MKRYKIVNKLRFYLFLIMVLTICFFTLMAFFTKSSAQKLVNDDKYYQIEIVEGDTLWHIALNYMPNGVDVRKVIDDINQLNGKNLSYIKPGEIIKIPQY